VILRLAVLIQFRRVCQVDGQTDRQTDEYTTTAYIPRGDKT